MESLNSFLNPKRKENIKFILSDAFIDETGKPILWEMKQLSAVEGIELQNQITSREYVQIMTGYVAASLVYPNLRDVELLKGISKKTGKTILKAQDALKEIVTEAELAELINKYVSFNSLTTDFPQKVDEAKN